MAAKPKPIEVTGWLANLLGPIDALKDGENPGVPRRQKYNLIGVEIVDEPEHDRTKLTFAGTAGAAEVQDDIAKSELTTPDAIDTVRGQNRIPFRDNLYGDALVFGTKPPRGGAWTLVPMDPSVDESISHFFAPDHPVPKGWYDPRHYGAQFDGTTDDILALEAMMADMPATGGWVHWPNAVCWISRRWIWKKPIWTRGQGGNDARHSGIYVAPGDCAIEMQDGRLNPSPTSTEVNGGAYSILSDLHWESHLLIAPDTARGSVAGDRALNTMNVDHSLVRNGDLYVRPGNAAPTRAFRATTPTPAAVQTDGSVPLGWSNTLGSTYTDANGILWTTESVPDVRLDSHAYVIGDRVFAKNDNRYYFECIVAGTSNASAPAEFAGGDFGKNAVNSVIEGSITDGTVAWKVKVACGVYINATQCKVRHGYGYKFSGYSVMCQAGTGYDARGAGLSDCNNFRLEHLNGSYCGGGIALAGDNCNGWTIIGCDGIKHGVYHPAATLFLDNGGTLDTNYVPTNGGRGGHGIFDKSQGGGCIVSSYGQVSTGKPIVKNSAGRTTFVNCFHEYGNVLPYFKGGVSTILSGNIVQIDPESDSVVVIDPAYGRGISEVDYSTGHEVHVQLSESANNRLLLRNRKNDSSQGGYAVRYDQATGLFLEEYNFNGPAGGNVLQVALEYGLPAAGLDPGPGFRTFRDGFNIGRSGTDAGAVFVGHQRARTSNLLRNGKRRAGDQFISGVNVITLTADGYRGIPWATGAKNAANTTTGQRGDMVEPTANVDTPNGGGQVWECTTSGTTAGSEPSWPGSPTANVTTVTDGTVTWTFRGSTPTYQTSVLREDRELTTTATTANQVIGSVTIPSAASGKVDVYRVFASFIGGGNGGRATGKVEGSFEVSDTGTVTRHGTDDTSTVKGTSSLASSTFSLNPTTNKIQLRVTPGTATSSKWRVLVQLEPLTGATA